MANDSTDIAPILAAAADGRVDDLVSLIEKGAIEATDENGNTPLMVAAKNGHVEVVDALLKHSINPNTRNYSGETALMLACAAGQPAVASLLIESNADIHAENWWGETAEALARRGSHSQLAELMQKPRPRIADSQPSRVGDMVLERRNKLVPVDGTKCWFCEKAIHEPGASQNVTLFSTRSEHRGSSREWSRLVVSLPTCKSCNKTRNRRKVAFSLYGLLVLLAMFGSVLTWNLKVIVISWALGFAITLPVAPLIDLKLRRYPLVRDLIRSGWYPGDKPPQDTKEARGVVPGAPPSPAPTAQTAPTSLPSSKRVAARGSSTIEDIDGNVYSTIKIGRQVWTVENLRTTRYNDGAPIPLVTSPRKWRSLASPGYCWYDNNPAHQSRFGYGALYNWYAVGTSRLAPNGWHIPTATEWHQLLEYLIHNGYNYDRTPKDNRVAKSLAARSDWGVSDRRGEIGFNLEENNRSGFSALPGGIRWVGGPFDYIGRGARWWCSQNSDETHASCKGLHSHLDHLFSNWERKGSGFSVRLLRD